MDGLGLATEMTANKLQQNAYYCRYDCDTMVNNVFVFGPDEKVLFKPLIIRGAGWMGPSLLILLTHKRKDRWYKICVDQGFPQSGDATGILVGPISERSVHWLHSAVRDNLIPLSNVYTSSRQTSEWGMRGLQGTFPQYKKHLPSDNNKQWHVLECIILVHNFWTEMVGHIRFRQCLHQSPSTWSTCTGMIGFTINTISLAIMRLTKKQSLWRTTLATKEKMKKGSEDCLGASQLGDN